MPCNYFIFPFPQDNNYITTSYGVNSGLTYFESENHPLDYGPRIRALYLLYLPGATQITFSFDLPFGLETNKDELYVGTGLAYAPGDFNGQASATGDKYYFDSRIRPQEFTLQSDTAWVYFLSDKNNDEMLFEGFRIRWSSADNVPPVVSCIDDIIETSPSGVSTGVVVNFEEPTATDNSGIVTLASRSHASGSFFLLGFTRVTYIFRDPSGNSGSCSFNVQVAAGKTWGRYLCLVRGGGKYRETYFYQFGWCIESLVPVIYSRGSTPKQF